MPDDMYQTPNSVTGTVLPDTAPEPAPEAGAPVIVPKLEMQRAEPSARFPFAPPPGTLDYLDYPAVRTYFLDRAARAVAAAKPVSNDRFRLSVTDVGYTGREPTAADEERAIRDGRSLTRRLAGRYELTDLATGEVKRSGRRTLMNVPWLSRQGFYVMRGVPYAFWRQFRMDPGIYARVADDGKAEAQFNVAQGTGMPFRIQMDPESGVFHARIAGKGIPLYHLLRGMGVSDEAMRTAWGRGMFDANRAKRPHSAAVAWMHKATERERGILAREAGAPPESIKAEDALRSYFNRMRLDEENTRRLMGRPYATVSADALLHASARALKVARGEDEGDDRDNPSNQRIFDEGDHLETYINLDRGGVMRTALWKLRNDPARLDKIPAGLFDQHIQHHINGAGLAQVLEQINPLDSMVRAHAVTRLGEGSISDVSAAPMAAREVQPGYLSFVDPIKAPESIRVGLDMYLARAAVKGPDNRLYTRLRDNTTGEIAWVNPTQLEGEFVAEPGASKSPDRFIPAMSPRHGIQYLPKSKVRYELVGGDDLFSQVSDTAALKSGIKGMRLLMGCVSGSTEVLVLRKNGTLHRTVAKEYEWLQGDRMYSADNDGSSGWREVRGVKVSPEGRSMLRVTTSSGRYIDTTDNHLWVRLGDEGGMDPTPAADLRVGDYVPRMGNVRWEGTVTEFLIEGKPYKHCVGARTLPADFDTGWIMGLYLAEGSLQKQASRTSGVLFAASAPDIQTRVLQFFHDMGVHARPNRKSTYVRVCWTGLAEWVGRNLGHGSFRKRLSGDLLNTPEAFRSGLLAGYLAGDGCVSLHRGRATAVAVSRSRRLVDDMALVCTSLGIDATCCAHTAVGKPAYRLRIRTEDAKHLPRLGHKGKDGRLAAHSGVSGRKSYKDIPLHDKLREALVGATKRKSADRSAVYAHKLVSRERVQRLLDRDACPWAYSDVIWDTVASVESIVPDGEVYDFDLGGHVFAPACGVFIHNSKFLSAALPLAGGEAPLVQTPGRDGTPAAELLGRYAGAVRSPAAGTVVSVDPHGAVVRSDDGTEHRAEWYSWIPLARKTYLEQTPVVKEGDRVEKGGLLARSNFTDDKGSLALGRNLRTAFMSYKGYNFEDAIVVSESAARDKMASAHMYKEEIEPEPGTELSTDRFVGLFPTRYTKDQIGKLGRDGVVRPGATLERGDPILLAVSSPEPGKATMGRRLNMDSSVAWDREDPGVVREVVRTPKGVRVFVESRHPLRVGDKLANFAGGKGVVSLILPDDQMPRDSEGRHLEMLLSPKGIPSRVNPALVLVAKLGRVAAKTGKPYMLEGYSDDDLVEFTERELAKNGVPDTEEVTDPVSGKKIPGIGTGLLHVYRMQQEAEEGGHSRETGGYTMDDEPSRGGHDSSKHIGDMEYSALLASGAAEVLKDLKTVHGQANPDFWRQVKLGGSPQLPRTPAVYDKFRALIRAANVRLDEGTPEGDRVFAATNDDIAELTGDREITSGETYDRKMNPIKGGLFDVQATDSQGAGNRFAHIKLPEPMLNPLMSSMARHLLGLREADLDDIASGRTPVAGKRGGEALKHMLEGLDLEQVAKEAKATLKGDASASRKDSAAKRLMYANAMIERGRKPSDFMMTRVPVLPPRHRRIAEQGDRLVVPDLNYLYRRLIQANDDLRGAKGLGEEAEADARAAAIGAYRALVGVDEPADKDLQAKRVGGVTQQLLGKGSPKFSLSQRKVLGFNVDLSAMGVVVPNPKLRITQVGIPEEFAWDVFGPFVVRRMVQEGRQATDAATALKDRSAVARAALHEEMRQRPVLLNRAPTLHRYGIVAFEAVPVPGRAIQVSPQIVGPYGMDFDGDKASFTVPVTRKAVREAWDKMAADRNLISRRLGEPHYAPSQEFHEGLYIMTKAPKAKAPKLFASRAEMREAWRRGEISLDDPVQIKE